MNTEENKHDFMTEELLMPNCNKTESNRGYMFSAHFSQLINLKKPELPLVFTRFENEFGKYSDSGFYKAERDFKVIGKVEKNENVYFLIIQYIDNGEYDIVERRNESWLCEHYGFLYNNEKIDSLKKGDEVKKDEIISKCGNYDSENNFRYGTNLKCIFYTYKLKTLEDAIVLSKSAAKKLVSNTVEKVKVVINLNDILLNMNEDKNGEYKVFPNINEDCYGILCILRRLNNKKLYGFSNSSLRAENFKASDQIIYSNGTVTDIDIYSNIPEEGLTGEYNKQIRKLVIKRNRFNDRFYDLTHSFMEKKDTKYTDELLQMYNQVKEEKQHLNFSYENSKFSGVVITFTITKNLPMHIGSKITGRYGNKGVCSELLDDDTEDNILTRDNVLIVDDDKMPYIEEGEFKGLHADACLNPLGVPSRMNFSQLIEQELNFISMHIRMKIKKSKTLEEKEKWYFEFLKEVSPKFYDEQMITYKNFSLEEKEEFMKENEEKIYIYQAPFYGNSGLDDLKRLYEKYDFIKPFKFKGINIPLIMGEVYYIRLKHEASSKFSARGTSFENLKNLPSKSKQFKYKKAHHSNTPIRIGNQEVIYLLLTKKPEAVKKLMAAYSNNEKSKEDLLKELLTGDPYNTHINTPTEQSETEKIVKALFYTMGIELKDVPEED